VSEWDSNVSASSIRWIALLPLIAAVVHGLLIGLVRAKLSDRSIWSISLSAMAVAFGLSALTVFDLVGAAGGQPILDTLGPWIGGGVGPRSFSAELTFQFDPLSAVFCLAVTSIALAVYVTTIGLLRSGGVEGKREDVHRTFAMLDLLVGGTLVLILADNLLFLFMGWTGVGIASQLVASFDFEEPHASRAGAVTFVVGRIGDLGLLAAILLLFDGLSRAGAPTLSFRGIEAAFRLLDGQGVAWLESDAAASPALLELVGFGLVLAALTKCAQFPLHFWLPSSTTGPISATALMQSSTTVIVGVYLLLRFSFLLESAPGAMLVLVVTGAVTMLLASLAASTQLQIPRLVAFTTSCMLGLVVLGIGVGAHSAATFLLLTHAFIKAHLILALGIVTITLKGETDIRRMGGLAQRMRWTQVMVAIGCLALVGLPPFANFFPIEELLAFIQVSGRADRWLLIVIATTSLGILAFAMARAYFLIFWGNVRPGGLVENQLRDPTGWTQHGLTALAVMVVAAGLLTPSQFWGDPWGVKQMDSVGHFLVGSIVGEPDPLLAGAVRGSLIAALMLSGLLGVGIAGWRYAERGYRGEAKRPGIRFLQSVMREMFFIEQLYEVVLIRPLRGVSRWALEGMIETRLIDRVVVSGGSGLLRRLVWSGLRRIQNGRLQSYALLGLLTVLVIVSWMVV
jgi:NADH-quinone oxidoreductase subunit L